MTIDPLSPSSPVLPSVPVPGDIGTIFGAAGRTQGANLRRDIGELVLPLVDFQKVVATRVG